jgi:hypothetical protein
MARSRGLGDVYKRQPQNSRTGRSTSKRRHIVEPHD